MNAKNPYLNAFLVGAKKGARETPREFFRPLINIFVLFGTLTELMYRKLPSAKPSHHENDHRSVV
jgi:hypothetical protein